MDPLVKYVEQEVKKGFSEELIKEKLVQSGYNQQEIAFALRDYHTKQHYHKFIDKIVEEEAKHKWFFAILAVLFIILAVFFIVTLLLSLDWKTVLEDAFPSEETVALEPQQESDCSIFSHRDKERCLLRVAAYTSDTSFCTNMTSKVMKYECKTEVWNKNYCNFLILTNQSTVDC